MKACSFLILVLCASPACRTTDEPAPAPVQRESMVTAPIAPKKAVEAVPATPAVPMPGESIPATPLVPMGRAQESPPPAPVTAASTRAERFTALKAEHEKRMDEYYDLFREAKTQEESLEISKTAKRPDEAPFVARANALIDEDAKDETALKAIQWLFENTHEDAGNARLCALVEAHHFASPQAGDFLRHLADAGAPGANLIRRLSEESPHETVRGRALQQRASLALQDERIASELRAMPDGEDKNGYIHYLGLERFQRLSTLDPAQAEEEALTLFQRVEKDYGAVKLRAGTKYESTLAEEAGANIFEIQNLAIGKTAPDIEGEDTSGVAFKLSDYRGKVVLLDFWGYW